MDKPKFNLLDAIIILLVIVAVAAGVYWALRPTPEAPVQIVNTVKAEFKFELTKVEPAVADEFAALKENDLLQIGTKDRFSGIVKKVEIVPTAQYVMDVGTQELKKAEDPTTFDVVLTLESDVIETDSTITASGFNLRVGEQTSVKGVKAAGYGFITALELKKD